MRIWHVCMLLAVVMMFASAQSVWAQTTRPAEETPVADARESGGDDAVEADEKSDKDGGETATQPGGGGKGGGGLFGSDPTFIIIMVVVMGLLWWWMGRGRRKEQQRHREMLTALKKGDKVTSIGGIIGTVIEVKDKEVVVKVDESSNVRMKFLRSAIRSVGIAGKDNDEGSVKS